MVKFSCAERKTWLNRWAGRNAVIKAVKITGGSKGMTLSRRKRKSPKYEEKIPIEGKKGLL